MIVQKIQREKISIESCHGGIGTVQAEEIIIGKERLGLRFFHETTVPPGATIAEHEHHGREELYIIKEGNPIFIDNGSRHLLKPGDVCIAKDGDSHGLINDSDTDVIFYVVGINVREQ